MASRELTKLDKRLLKEAGNGKSPVEIGLAVNLPPEQVLLRVQTILQDRDVWTERERRLMLLDDLYSLKDQLQTRVEGLLDPKDTANLLRVLKQLSEVTDQHAKMNNDWDEQASRVQARILLDLIVQAFDYAKNLLRDEHPEMDLKVIDSAFRAGLANVVIDGDEDDDEAHG